MKTTLSVLIVGLAAAGGYLAGRGGASGEVVHPDQSTSRERKTRSAERLAERGTETRKVLPKDRSKWGQGVTVDEAKAMTPQERMAIMRSAAVLADQVEQAAILCGLIPAMTKEELDEATKVLRRAQYGGGAWSQEVWNEIWLQWGRIDPEGALAKGEQRLGGPTTYEDYRLLMAGWMETAPNTAMEWARKVAAELEDAEPGAALNDQLDGKARAAALALMSDTGGDVGKMEEVIRGVVANGRVAKACLQDYFDVRVAEGGKTASEIYDSLSPELRQAAWPVAMYRLTYTNEAEAKQWVEQHAADPGRDYYSMYGMLERMARKDGKTTVEWATSLPRQMPGDVDVSKPHPATVSLSFWSRRDAKAARAWVEAQPADTPWVQWWNEKFPKKPITDASAQ